MRMKSINKILFFGYKKVHMVNMFYFPAYKRKIFGLSLTTYRIQWMTYIYQPTTTHTQNHYEIQS